MAKAFSRRPLRRKPRIGRTIETNYYNDAGVLLKTTKSKYARTAVKALTAHMHDNDYAATYAEVYDTDDGVLYAQVVMRLMNGKHDIIIHFERQIQKEH